MTKTDLEKIKNGTAIVATVKKKESLFKDNGDSNEDVYVGIGIEDVDLKNKIIYGDDGEAYDFDEVVSVSDGSNYLFMNLLK